MEFKDVLILLATPFLALGYGLTVIVGLLFLGIAALINTLFGDLL